MGVFLIKANDNKFIRCIVVTNDVINRLDL